MRIRTAPAVLSVAAATIAVLAATIPAHADARAPALLANPYDCVAGYLCMWHDQNFAGQRITMNNSDRHLGDDSDEAHAIFNRSGRYVKLYDNQDWTGDSRCVAPQQQVPDLGGFSDRVTSVQFGDSNPRSCGGSPPV